MLLVIRQGYGNRYMALSKCALFLGTNIKGFGRAPTMSLLANMKTSMAFKFRAVREWLKARFGKETRQSGTREVSPSYVDTQVYPGWR